MWIQRKFLQQLSLVLCRSWVDSEMSLTFSSHAPLISQEENLKNLKEDIVNNESLISPLFDKFTHYMCFIPHSYVTTVQENWSKWTWKLQSCWALSGKVFRWHTAKFDCSGKMYSIYPVTVWLLKLQKNYWWDIYT